MKFYSLGSKLHILKIDLDNIVKYLASSMQGK